MNETQLKELVAYWRGKVAAIEPLRPYLKHPDKIADAYVQDMTAVLDAVQGIYTKKTPTVIKPNVHEQYPEDEL